MIRTAMLMMAIALVAVDGRCGDIACDAGFLNQSWELLAKAGYGYKMYERAAFIVRESNESPVTFVMWSGEIEKLRATFVGVRPAHIVAVIHTHPNSVPLPSDVDVRMAARIGLPIYVLTRTSISRTDGARIETLRAGDWSPGADRSTGCTSKTSARLK